MKKLLLLFFILSAFFSFAQELEKSPKKITFEMGYTGVRKSNFTDISKTGFAFALDYGWQVSGFKNKPAAYISFPLGYTAIPPIKKSTKNYGISFYGVHITHNLKQQKNIVPFFGYSLLFNQVIKQDTDGRVIGHETRFDAGANLGKRLFAKIEYGIASYPALGQKITSKIGTWGLKVGVRIR
ncbi:hypothetical protein [Lacihabitans sp. LS3-19]|uniref:hypothetical protein n=1 Tax=Lacihabitans sp. LS3-19 TaxID=2487335 RepID=UPI0020CD28AA|nr:hypothetical protein [Lacihabitans sp. LS3-19]